MKRLTILMLLILPLLIKAQSGTDSLQQIIDGDADIDAKLKAYTEICNVLPQTQDASKIGNQGIELGISNRKEKQAAYIAANIGYRMIFEVSADSALHYFVLSKDLSLSVKDFENVVDQLTNIGYTKNYMGQPDSGLYYYNLALSFIPKLDEPTQYEANLYSNIGLIYLHEGKLKLALSNSIKALDKRKEIGDKVGIGMSYINVGGVYEQMNEAETAYEYYKDGAAACEEGGDMNCELSAKINMGTIMFNRENYKEALSIYTNVYEISRKANLKRVESNALANMGTALSAMGRYDEALEADLKALEIRKEINNKIGWAESLNAIGKVYQLTGRHDLAIKYFNESKAMAEELKNLRISLRASLAISEHFAATKNYKLAYENYVEFATLKDSLLNKENKELVQTLEAKFKSAEKEKEIAQKDAALAKEQQERQNEKAAAEKKSREAEAQAKQDELLRYGFLIGFLLMAITAFVIFRGYKNKKKANELITEQRDELEEKNQEILDSINYAKRIQTAILPPNKLVKEYLANSFVLYKPKDIVAGDFYWMEPYQSEKENENGVLFAAADCTGHGVPGAMVSVVCNNGLNRSVREHGLSDPGRILDKTREIVIAEFEKSEEEVKDGMDIALCSLQGTTLEYAGAHNPLWVIRRIMSAETAEGFALEEVKAEFSIATKLEQHDDYLFIEVKADKQPIGKYDNPKPYTTHTIELNEGDSFYIFSDGYADQFGGEKGKKFKAANFKNLLLSIQSEPMERQRIIIDEAFEKWKGEIEQLDDVCVIGVRM